MFADIRKKFFAALVGSLMFFGTPNCSAGGAGVAMITSGILPALYGGYETFFGVFRTAAWFSGGRCVFINSGGERVKTKANGMQTLNFIVQNIVRGVSILGSGVGLIVGGTKL